MAAFRGGFPLVTRLENGEPGVNLAETCTRAASPKLPGDAPTRTAAAGHARSRRQAQARRDRPRDRAHPGRRSGMVRGSPRRVRPVAGRLRVRHDPEQHRRRAAAPVRHPRAGDLPRRLPPARPAGSADPACLPAGRPGLSSSPDPICRAIARPVGFSGGRQPEELIRRMRCHRSARISRSSSRA
jgi:hypothetical protein